jgi:hypothetical protein
MAPSGHLEQSQFIKLTLSRMSATTIKKKRKNKD